MSFGAVILLNFEMPAVSLPSSRNTKMNKIRSFLQRTAFNGRENTANWKIGWVSAVLAE